MPSAKKKIVSKFHALVGDKQDSKKELKRLQMQLLLQSHSAEETPFPKGPPFNEEERNQKMKVWPFDTKMAQASQLSFTFFPKLSRVTPVCPQSGRRKADKCNEVVSILNGASGYFGQMLDRLRGISERPKAATRMGNSLANVKQQTRDLKNALTDLPLHLL